MGSPRELRPERGLLRIRKTLNAFANLRAAGPVKLAPGDGRQRFATPSGRLEFYSSTLKEWGWAEHALPTYIRSHVHPDSLGPDEMPLVPILTRMEMNGVLLVITPT